MPTVLHHRLDMATGAGHNGHNQQDGGVVSLNLDEEDQDGDQESMDIVKNRKKQPNSLIKMVRGMFQKKEVELKVKEVTTSEMIQMLQPSRYRPEGLDQMAEATKFTREEVKFLYRDFKQECPNGIMDEDTFKIVYGQIFPLGDSSRYAHLVFNSIDRENTGSITFGDFMEFLSILTKGSILDKLQWSFQFYDVNRDGKIDREEMKKVSESIFDLMGPGGMSVRHLELIDRLFDKMDTNRDGVVTLEEFVQYCNSRDNIRSNFLVMT